MNVAEIIALLEKQPKDMRVIVRGYEDGYNDIAGIETVTIALDQFDKSYYGQHKKQSGTEPEGAQIEEALHLWGENTLDL